ncbi:MAG: CHASE domain-containing protein [Oleiphilus sp.]
MKKNKNVQSVLVLALLAVISFVSAHYFEQQQRERNQQRLSQELKSSLQGVTQRIHQSLEIYSLELKSLRSYIYNIGFENLSYSRFLKYAQDSELEENYPGSRGFGFIRLVPKEKEQAYLDQISKDRGKPFQIKYLAKHSESRFVIEYIEPEAKNQQAVGLDIGSESHRRYAALSAAHKNAVTLTAPITLVQANAKTKHGFLLLYPVYASLGPESVFNASQAYGWVYAPLLIDEILSSIQQKESGLRLQISDVTSGQEIDFFDGVDADFSDSSQAGPSVVDIELFERVWRIHAHPSQTFVDKLDLASPQQVFYFVLTLIFCLALLTLNVWSVLNRRLQGMRQKAEIAAIVENGIEGIIGLDSNFCFNYWNDAAKHLLDFDESVAGKPFLEWLESSYSSDYLIGLFKRVLGGESVKGLELNLSSNVGESKQRYLHLNFQPIIQKGTFLGANVSMLDLTELRTLQQQLEEKNQLLKQKVSRQNVELKTTEGLHESLLEGADYLIITTDTMGKITSVNRKLDEWLGYDHDEILGQPVVQLFDKANLEKLSANLLSKYKFQTINLFDALIYQLRHQPRIEGEYVFKDRHSSTSELQLTISTIKTVDNEVFGYLFMADDIRDQKALKFDLELVRSAVRNSEDIFLWLDQAGSIKNCNPFSWLSLGYSEFELRHMNIHDLIAFDSEDSWQEMVNDLLALGTVSYEKDFIDSQGKKIPCLVTLAELKINNNVFFFLDAKDISERLVRERSLEDALNLASKANMVKDQFLAIIGHELRTPLNEVYGSLQMIKLTELSRLQKGYVSQAKASVRHLTQAIDDVLDCGEIVRNKLSLFEQEFDLIKLLDAIASDVAVLAEDKNIEINFDLSQELPKSIKADPKRLNQLLMCLLNNAIKFTEQGDVVLTCSLKKEFETGYELEFSITDSGIGISEDKQKKIFDLFSQAEMDANRSFGGLGLGLTISKCIVELMSGQIRCNSIVNKGTTFTFTLKVEKSKCFDESQPVPSARKQLHVLIVDDNEISLSVLSKLIEQQGWLVTSARDAASALDILRDAYKNRATFDLALIDFNMPFMTGIDLIKNAKVIFEEEALPVFIMVTAYSRGMLMSVQGDDLDSLVNAYLAKPVTQSMLLSAVSDTFSREQACLTEIEPEKALLGYKILLVEDNETNQFIACNLLEREGANVTACSDGEDAWAVLNRVEEAFDIVLMDIQMPGWDGYQTTQTIRADSRFDRLPILAMTANILPADKKNCMDVGMNGHIGKPFELNELVQAIQKLVAKDSLKLDKASIQQLEKHTDPSNLGSGVANPVLLALQTLSDVNLKQALLRFSGSEELFVQSLSLFQQDLSGYLATLSDDQQLEDLSKVKPIFHTLKGTAGLLGFTELSNIALECDRMVDQIAQEGRDSEPLSELIRALNDTLSIIQSVFSDDLNGPNNGSRKGGGLADTAGEDINIPEQESSTDRHFEIDLALLDELKVMLKNANMKAVDVYKKIELFLMQSSPVLAEKLSSAIMNLKFKEALTLLDDIQKMLSERVNEKNNE